MRKLSLIKKALFHALQNDQIEPKKMNFLLGGDGSGGGDDDGDQPGDAPWNP